MLKRKFFTTLLIVLAVLFAQVGSVLAAPEAQETTPITGTIQTIMVQPGVDGAEPVVVVTVLDDMGETQTVYLSVEAAAGLGLLETDPATGEPILDPVTGLPSADQSKLEQPISIDPTLINPVEEEEVHPIAAILASFFGEDPGVVNQYHEDGFGFGVIAQAMWMAHGLEETNTDITADLILTAKQDKDFSAFVLPDGSTPSNWGQFKKAALGKDKKNLGVIVSGHAGDSVDDTITTQQENGNGNNNGGGNGNGNGNGRGNENRNGNGNGNGNNRP